jgi:hypothetical protein
MNDAEFVPSASSTSVFNIVITDTYSDDSLLIACCLLLHLSIIHFAV